MDDLLPEFLTETNEALAELDLALVKLERVPDDQATLSLIFRLVHTIKGTCGFLGLPRLERVAHAAENVLGRVRDGELTPTADVINLVLASLDRIKAIVAELGRNGAEPQGDDTAVIEALNQAASGQPQVPTEPLTVAKPRPASRRKRGKPTVASHAEPPAEAAAHVAALPPPASEHLPPAAPEAASQTIRVAVDVLEELMTLVGELVLTRNQLLQLSRGEAANEGATTAFGAPLQRLSHITSDLQEKVMKTRMQPIGTAWNKLPRLVRDLAQETGKLINLDMRGQDTELDRQVLELMRDPLTHMVRNSADHGLETSAERRLAGKSDAGRITLNAYHEGGHIIIEISDDGRGIDVGRVRAKALAKGLATESELTAMSDAQIRAFIFRAGFSTAETVTAISGRGVGMDVVRSNIERIGGTIELASTQGSGSCFTIKIPLTLAIVSAVIVRSAGERFAIPQIAVRELVRVGEDASTAEGANLNSAASVSIEQVGGAAVLRLRNELLPLVDLAGLLRLERSSEPRQSEDQTVVIAAIGPLKLGIVVDEVFDTEEIVVKPVAPVLRHVTMFSGNTILGDGSVIMILDPNGIARSAGIAGRSSRAQEAAAAPLLAESEERIALLLFRGGGRPGLFAVPLSLVARLETIATSQIESSSGGYVTQYRGQLMKLIAMQDADQAEGAEPHAPSENQSVLVFADGARSMGLMVDSIVDVLHANLKVELGSHRRGVLGTAVIGGQAADVLDTGFWLTMAWRDWFASQRTDGTTRPRVLVIEDSDFFRQLLIPALSAVGYEVISACHAEAAIELRDGGLMVDAVISDIEMPGMGGLEFARLTRRGGNWSRLPLIALSAHDGSGDESSALQAGFTAFVKKSERGALIEQLRACLARSAAEAVI